MSSKACAIPDKAAAICEILNIWFADMADWLNLAKKTRKPHP
jgi:hypothetical protein